MSEVVLEKPTRPCDRCRKRKTKCVFEAGASLCYLCKISRQPCELNLPPLKKRKKPSSPGDSETANGSGGMTDESPGSQSGNMMNNPELTPKRPVFPRYLYQLDGGNEFDSYIFGSLMTKHSVDLSKIDHIRRSVINTNGNLFLEFETNMDDINLKKAEHAKIDKIIGDFGPKLMALYFRIVHISFPIVYKDKFLDYYNEDVTAISPCLRACLYMFALNWWSFDLELSSDTRPSQEAIEQLAELNFHQEIKRPTLETIQAGLLLVQHQSFRNKYDDQAYCWPVQAAIVAASQTLGLNKDPTNWDIPPWEKVLRKRLSWGLYIQEKWLSFTTDKMSHLRPDDWAVPSLNEDTDFDDFKETDNDYFSKRIDGKIDLMSGKVLFLQKIELTKIIDEIQIKIYSAKGIANISSLNLSDPVVNLKKILDYIKPLQSKLTKWESQLPKILIIEPNVSRGFISGAPNIYISNFMAQISVLRPVLQTLSSIRELKSVVGLEFMGIRDIVFNKCMTIFEKVIQFLNEMRAEHLQTFWYTSVRHGLSNVVIFGFLLTLISKSKQELDVCMDKIEEYVWKLKINNKNAEFFLHAINWWAQMKNPMSQILENMTFYNEPTSVKQEPQLVYMPPQMQQLPPQMQQSQMIQQPQMQFPFQQSKNGLYPGFVQDINENYLLPELFNLESIDNFIFNYQNE